MRRIVLLVTTLALLPVAASAAPINITTSGTTVYTTAITDFATLGKDMAGMQVAISGGAPASWADMLDGNFGVLFADGTKLYVGANEDTFAGDWTLFIPSTSRGITSLFIDGVPGQTTFDRTWSPYPGTPDSANGWDMSGFGNVPVNLDYQNPLALGAGLPVGDEWVRMYLTFPDVTGGGLGLLGPGTYTFRQDSDNATTQIVDNPVPEPTSMLLLGTGLVGLAARARRKRQ